jgi:hypothetical protein
MVEICRPCLAGERRGCWWSVDDEPLWKFMMFWLGRAPGDFKFLTPNTLTCATYHSLTTCHKDFQILGMYILWNIPTIQLERFETYKNYRNIEMFTWAPRPLFYCLTSNSIKVIFSLSTMSNFFHSVILKRTCFGITQVLLDSTNHKSAEFRHDRISWKTSATRYWSRASDSRYR